MKQEEVIVIICLSLLLLLSGLKIFHHFFQNTYEEKNLVSRIPNVENIPLDPPFRVVVSFSTIPSRTKYIVDAFRRLSNQTFKPDMIYACIPYYSKRMKRKYELPEDLSLPANCKIVRCPDYGPATKLLGCIREELNPDTLIITIDDDQQYIPTLLQQLVAYAMKYPDHAIGTHASGENLLAANCLATGGKNITSPHAYYLEGFGGVAYRRGFITDEMLDYFENLSPTSPCFISDDLTISTWLDLHNIPRLRLCLDREPRYTVNQVHQNNPLNEEAREATYDGCICELEMLKSKYRYGQKMS